MILLFVNKSQIMPQPSIRDLDEDLMVLVHEHDYSVSEIIFSAFFDQRTHDAYAAGQKAQWPLPILNHIEAKIMVARFNDQPWNEEDLPEDFLEFARGTDAYAKAGYWVLQTWDHLINSVGSLSQSQHLAQWLVDEFKGQPLMPVVVDPKDLEHHAKHQDRPQYLVRWRGSTWVISGFAIGGGEVLGPNTDEVKRVSELDQVWFLAPTKQS